MSAHVPSLGNFNIHSDW